MNDTSYKHVPRCVDCFRVTDVREANEIYMQDEAIRDGHYSVIYAYGAKRPYCYDCRHRMAAFIRLVRMQQGDGYDVRFSNTAEEPMTDEERFARCRNCGGSGVDSFGMICPCPKGQMLPPAPPMAGGVITTPMITIVGEDPQPELIRIPDGATVMPLQPPPPRRIKIKIVSDGKPQTTRILDAETGQELEMDILSFTVECDPNNHVTCGIPVAHLVIFNPELAIIAEADVEERGH